MTTSKNNDRFGHIVLIIMSIIALVLLFAPVLDNHFTKQNEEKLLNELYYFDIDEVDDTITCIILTNGLGEEIIYLDTRFGSYDVFVQRRFRAIVETQAGISGLYNATLKYNEIIDGLIDKNKVMSNLNTY